MSGLLAPLDNKNYVKKSSLRYCFPNLFDLDEITTSNYTMVYDPTTNIMGYKPNSTLEIPKIMKLTNYGSRRNTDLVLSNTAGTTSTLVFDNYFIDTPEWSYDGSGTWTYLSTEARRFKFDFLGQVSTSAVSNQFSINVNIMVNGYPQPFYGNCGSQILTGGASLDGKDQLVATSVFMVFQNDTIRLDACLLGTIPPSGNSGFYRSSNVVNGQNWITPAYTFQMIEIS